MTDAAFRPERYRAGFADRLSRMRYQYVPDHLLGEILTKRWVDNVAPFAFMLLAIAFFGWSIDGFFTAGNLAISSRQLGEFGFVVLAMTIVIIAGGIDLSVGSNFALGNFVALYLMNVAGWQVGPAFVGAVSACACVGFLNGALVGLLRLRAFLTTLVTLIIVRAVVDMLLLRYAVDISAGFPESAAWDFIGFGSVLGIPFSALLLAVVVVAGHIFLTRTRPGWRIVAVGGSRRSAHNSGISVRWTVCGSYVISGVLVGIAGFLYAARLSSAGSDAGMGLELAALTAAVLGGNSLGGGRGSAAKAIMGAITVLIITNGVIRIGLPSGAGAMVLGIVLLLAATLDVRWLKNRHKMLASVYVSPVVNDLPPYPDTSAGSGSPYEVNDKLRDVELIGLRQIEAPEDVIFDRNDNLYCGSRQGDIVRFLAPDYTKHEIFAHIGGQPLGLAFDRDQNLYVCVGGMGLYAVAPDGAVTKATDETRRSTFSVIDDSRLRLADDLDIAPDGRVYFSEGTIRYDMHEWPVDSLEGRGNGRILCYDPRDGSTRTILRKLRFPNGICISFDGKSMLFAETFGACIKRYWIEGPKAGSVETVIDSLPGYPDNINRASDGTYWLAMVGMRTPVLDLAFQMPGFRRRMARRVSHDEWLYPNINTGCVLKFDERGNILDALWDLKGTNHPMITSMREHKGSLFLGGLSNNRIGRYRLPNADQAWTANDNYWGRR